MEQQYNFPIGTWLYVKDGNVEMLFEFLKYEKGRWIGSKGFHVINGEDVYIFQGQCIIVTTEQVVEAGDSNIGEILDLAESQNKEND